MGNRGQKRADMVDELPADKRACSSLDFRPSSSNSSVQTQVDSVNANPETHEGDMETSSSSTESSQSEGEPEKESTYGSCDSEGSGEARLRHNITLRQYQQRQSLGDQGKIKRILSSLSEEGDGDSGKLAALTELCEVLSFCSEDSLSTVMSDSLSPVLVKLANHETSPDVMLLAIRAITYMCDVFPRAGAFLVRHDAVPALCQKLMAVQYLDVAEQCLQALDKISRDQPLACLQSGAIMAVLNFIDFFSTSIQRVALSTVVNICEKLPSECPSPFMEAVPTLCNLLQYEDRQLVENVAVCLIKIADRVRQSPEMLDELCKNGLIHQVTHLIDLNSRTTLSQPIYTGFIGLLAVLASGSFIAVRTLFELNISRVLKDILSSYDLSHGMPSPHVADGRCNQVHEVLKLLNELLPSLARDQDVQLVSDKESYMVHQPDLLQKLGRDILPSLIQAVNSGANLYVCYGCLSVIKKLVNLSKPEMLLELLKSTNMSRFLAGVLTRKDHHVLLLALQIAEVVLQKLSNYYMNLFIKEGVFFAIDALLTPEKCSQLMFPVSSGIQLSIDSNQKFAAKEVLRCLCYAFDAGQFLPTETGTCKLEKDSVQNLAKNIWTNHFAADLRNPEGALTDILQKLRTLSTALSDILNTPTNNDVSAQHEEKFHCILHQILEKLSGSESISTFEFIESGIVKSLVTYLYSGLHMREKVEHHDVLSQAYILEKRYSVFARLFLSLSGPSLEDLPFSVFIRKLHTALSSMENFPVILSHAFKQRNSYATVPNRSYTTYPCLRVRFVKGEGETSLSDYSEDILTVDPFSSLDAIEGFLWARLSKAKLGCMKSASQAVSQTDTPPSNASLLETNVPDHMDSDSMSSYLPEMQADGGNLPHTLPEVAIDLEQMTSGETPSSVTLSGSVTEVQHPASSSNKDDSKNLLFFLEGHLLDRALTLYQAIIQQEMKADHGMFNVAKLWTQVYTITYKTTADPKINQVQTCSQFSQNSSILDKVGAYWQCAPFLSGLFDSELASDLDQSSSTYNILLLLKSLESMNRFAFQLMSNERTCAFAEGRIDDLDSMKVLVRPVPQNEFVSNKLTEKLQQQMRDPLAVSIGGMPSWCNHLMASCPFLFGFEARCKYFRLAAFGPLLSQTRLPSHGNSSSPDDRRPNAGGLPRKKFLVCRDHILDSAMQLMDLHAHHKGLLEVEFKEEVGTGLGPTLEFYTLVSHEFQKSALGLWREDRSSPTSESSHEKDSGILASSYGLFPCPWSCMMNASNGILFSEVIKKFVLLGQVVARALQDGRVLDVPFSKAFYKLVLGQELSLYDIQSFDPELGRALIEFKALVDRKRFLDSACGVNSTFKIDSCFRNTSIEDLFLDFTLPGYPDYVLTSGPDYKMVNMRNLEEYVSLIVDATINAGISRQVEAFKSGFNQVFPIKHLQIFTEEELERLLCGEHDSWGSHEFLDHVKFDHGYTASSPPILNFLETIQEFDHKRRRAFLQFVTGAPRLPPGGLASLNPKMTIVRKHSSIWVDADLPSVMTCANYLKLPPYSSKEKMKEKLLYAITEGQGSFHLS